MTAAMDIIDGGVRAANERVAAREALDPSNIHELRMQLSTVASDEKLVDTKFTQVPPGPPASPASARGADPLLPPCPSQHYRMKKLIVQQFDDRHMHDVAKLEQALLTGCNDEGEKVRCQAAAPVLRGAATALVCSPGRPQGNRAPVEGPHAGHGHHVRGCKPCWGLVDRARCIAPPPPPRCVPCRPEDQARLILLYVLCHKSVDARVRDELIALSGITAAHRAAISNLVNLHIPIARSVRDDARPCAGLLSCAT